MTVTAAAPPAIRPDGARIPMSRTTRRVVLVVHVWTAGAWLGLDVAMAALVVTALRADDPALRAALYQALEVVVVWPLTVAGLGCLASGLLLGLGTRYGLLRFWWVAVKLVINLFLSTLVLVLLRPNAQALAGDGRRLAAGQRVDVDVSSLVMPPTVTVIALTFAFYLSIGKPWGRTSVGRRARPS